MLNYKFTKMNGVKQKQIVVTMDQKLKAIDQVDKCESVKLINDELGVGITIIKDWCKIRINSRL